MWVSLVPLLRRYHLPWRDRAASPTAVCLDGKRCLSRQHPLYLNPSGLRPKESNPLPKTPSDSQDEMAQGAYPSNPNATGACKSGWYKPHTTGTFDDNYDQDGGLGQITTKINDGYPVPDGDILKRKGTT